MKKIILPVISLLFAVNSMAQYPDIPDSTAQRETRMKKEIYERSMKAWEKALPIVKQEESLGRPYRPWAAKPTTVMFFLTHDLDF